MMKSWRDRALLAVLVLAVGGADWRQFRGSDSTGVATEPAARHLGDKFVAWKATLPGRGPSSPIIVGERGFTTASGDPRPDRLNVIAFDAKTGAKLWQRNFWGTGPTDSHPKTSMAAPTPASDGQRVVALFATGDLICLDLDGNVLWIRSLYEENPGATDGRGLASSPLIVGPTVVVHVENQNTSFAAGIDMKTGANRWRLERPREYNWTSPIVLPGKTPSNSLVLLQGSTRLTAVDPLTGRLAWELQRGTGPIASSVLAGNVLYVPGETALAALELQPNQVPPKILWEKPKLNPETASPLVLDGRVYVLRGPILVAGDAKTGEVRGQLRLKGSFSASIIAAGGLLYCFSEDGLAQVVQPTDKDPKLLQSRPFDETILATPAIADGALYVRSNRHLWKITKSQG
jgi:outer membrane protein assembly factor BamB